MLVYYFAHRMDSIASSVQVLCPVFESGDIIARVCQQIFVTSLHQYDPSLTRGSRSQWQAELSFRIPLPLVLKIW